MIEHPLRTRVALISLLLAVVPLLSEGPNRGISASTGRQGNSGGVKVTDQFELRPAIVFASTRDNPTGVGSGITAQERIYNAAELYVMMMTDDGMRDLSQVPRRLTTNEAGDTFAALSPSGKQILFDSNRARFSGEPYQVTDLYVADLGDHDDLTFEIPDEKQIRLTRGGSATWSPDGKYIAFQASASGIYTTETLARSDPGTPALDSDIFILNVDDCMEYAEECLAKQKAGNPGVLPEFLTNITRDKGPASVIDEDPDWSPDGQTIVFTSHDGEAGKPLTGNHNNAHAEIYLINADGTGLQQLTHNGEEERGPAWSRDGSKILFICRRSDPPGQRVPFDLSMIERDAQGGWVETRLTSNDLSYLTPHWSPDGNYIVFHRPLTSGNQLFRLTFTRLPDGTYTATDEMPLTASPVDQGHNIFANWDRIRVRKLD